MRPLFIYIAFAVSVSCLSRSAEPQPVSAHLLTSPASLPKNHDQVWVFLGGSIDMGAAPDWQSEVVQTLKNQDILFLNPRRSDWNPAWRADANDPNFRQQVLWELRALEAADIIVMYFAPNSQSPISLLELGLHARSGKLIVLCPQGYWRKGNVDITSSYYHIDQVASVDELLAVVQRRVAAAQRHSAR